MDILGETGMLDCELVDTSMIPNVKLVPNQGESFAYPKKCKRLVGSFSALKYYSQVISQLNNLQ